MILKFTNQRLGEGPESLSVDRERSVGGGMGRATLTDRLYHRGILGLRFIEIPKIMFAVQDHIKDAGHIWKY